MENTYLETETIGIDKDVKYTESKNESSLYGLLPMFILVAIVFLRISWVLYKSSVGQKTRSQQQRRFVGTRGRPSEQPEPTIYVSPANLPPPPKYEALAPPSYEEVMAVNYPNYPGIAPQPIAYPLTHSVGQSSTSHPQNTTRDEGPTSTVITVTADERRTSVTVATS